VELLPIPYTGVFLILACFCYACCLSIPKLKPFAGRSLVAVLAFGACAYVGFFVVILGVYHAPLRPLLGNGFRSISYAVAYFMPGLVGSWFSLWAMR
jgi:hypothetical protein